MDQEQTVAYLGPEGTFSQAAALQHFGDEGKLVAYGSIDEVFSAVAANEVEFGVVPVENSTEGAVNNTQDCLIDSEVHIVGEQVIPIVHNLLIQPGANRAGLTTIASHKQSLAQCRQWLLSHYPDLQLVECASNAEAARLASKDASVAAIAGQLCADIYRLQVVAAGIQDQEHNRTRFLVLSWAGTEATGNDKTSVLIYTENKPGALFRVLEPFEQLQVSLTKIETRPSKKEAWEYVFFIDFEGHRDDPRIGELFARLAGCTAEVKLLGSYPSATAQMTS